MAVDDGGAAFPISHLGDGNDYSTDGMSLRDYFAGQVVASVYRDNGGGDGLYSPSQPGRAKQLQGIARDAYDIADALIAARKGGE